MSCRKWSQVSVLFLLNLILYNFSYGGDLKKVTFRFQPVIAGVGHVELVGTFNDWNTGKNPMQDDDGDGVFSTAITLETGKYFYKYVVDGNWIIDPQNPNKEADHNGKVNSVIVIDDSYETIVYEKGDGKISILGIPLKLDYGMVNPFDKKTLIFTTRSHTDDVDKIKLMMWDQRGKLTESPMNVAATGMLMDYYQAKVEFRRLTPLYFTFVYEDGEKIIFATPSGFTETFPEKDTMFYYSPDELPVFSVPDWVKDGVFYQIFPDRFCNGDPSNDPDFSESYYQGKNELPASGKINGDYFHLEKDWNNIDGLSKSPYRTDGKPDLYSFYGGDIQGVINKLPYLKDLGVTIIYFNPLAVAKSNHKYDPIDYMKLDPHFSDEKTFKEFTRKAHKLGIRVIVDKAFNHCGDENHIFLDTVKKGEKSKYWHWFEWHKWPLPEGGCPTPCDYYDCWWGFPLHPNFNFDLSRPNDQENDIYDINEADPNTEVVNYILDVARYWLGDLKIDGFRLDVPNEVPHWFWKEFRKVVDEENPDAFLIGEIWGNAMPWLGPDGFHVTMNYKYFRDPVLQFIARGKGDAERFHNALAPGRVVYPIQSVQGMMNLIDSHDTERFLYQAHEDVRKIKLAALFQMTYVGVPQIYYGDEVALTGGKDPDNRRTFPWNWENDDRRKNVHRFYQKIIGIRHSIPALRTGRLKKLLCTENLYAYLREDNKDRIIVVLNNDDKMKSASIQLKDFGFKEDDSFLELIQNQKFFCKSGVLNIHLGEYEGAILKLN